LRSVTRVPTLVPTQLPALTISSQPPSISAHVVRNPEVKSLSFSFRENHSFRPSPCFAKYSRFRPHWHKTLASKTFHHPYAPGMWCPSLHMALSIIFILVATPQFLRNSRRLDPQKLAIAKTEF
jgi:hypothetical protein